MLMVKRHVEQTKRWNEELVDEDEVLKPLPVQFRRVVLEEVRTRYVEKHDFVLWLQGRHTIVFREMVHTTLTVSQVQANQSFFVFGDLCHHMLFVEFGKCLYVQDKRANGFISRAKTLIA